MICIVAARGEEHRSGAQTVDRALGVLRCFETGEDEIRLRDLADRSGLSLSTTHRLVRSLVAGGLLVQNPVTDRYALGPALVVLGRRAGAHLGYDAALPALTELAEQSGESVNLGIRRGPDVLVVLDVASRSPLRFTQPAGSRVPVHSSAMGKCLLAFSDDPAREVAELPVPGPTDRAHHHRAGRAGRGAPEGPRTGLGAERRGAQPGGPDHGGAGPACRRYGGGGDRRAGPRRAHRRRPPGRAPRPVAPDRGGRRHHADDHDRLTSRTPAPRIGRGLRRRSRRRPGARKPVKRLRRMLLVTTNNDEKAIVAAATIGSSTPAAARGMAATL